MTPYIKKHLESNLGFQVFFPIRNPLPHPQQGVL